MSAAFFFHKISELNWKVWGAACLATGLAASLSLISVKPETIAGEQGKKNAMQAFQLGHYRPARRLADMALLRARISRDKSELVDALIASAKIDSEFEEFALADTLAREALELSLSLDPKDSLRTAAAKVTLADTLADNESAISLYKEALKIYKKQRGAQSAEVARVLLELSKCYELKEQDAAAVSAAKAAMRMLESSQSDKADYAKSLLQYCQVADLESAEKLSLAKTALNLQERNLGATHPDLSQTLLLLAAEETNPSQKEAYLSRAIQIDEETFGSDSIQLARDLSTIADLKESAGKKSDSVSLRNRAAKIYMAKVSAKNIKLSCELLDSYSKLLHSLKLDKEAERIDLLLSNRKKELQEQSQAGGNGSAISSAEVLEDDITSDPEYWQRVEIVPIQSVQNFASDFYDHIQLWYQRGELKLEAFKEGEIVFQDRFAECPTGIVNATADQNIVTVSWRDGDGPIWHNDNYRISKNNIKLLSSKISDAYAQQIKQQLDGVLGGDPDAVNEGSVELVPSSYINNNFISEAIKSGESKALKLYGEGDASAAADRLAMIFDFTTKAINSQRNDLNPQLTRQQSWIDAWKFQGIAISDYITALNDYGYFLQQNGCLKESTNVLTLVTEISPERAIAHLNLADSFWKLGKVTEAKQSYKTYISLMKEARDQRQIPSRVMLRLAPAACSIKTVPNTISSSILGV